MLHRAARDTDFFIKLSDQFPQSCYDRAKGLNPFAELITRGWLRASHRALDPARSSDMVPYHSHSDPQPLQPNEIYKFEISLEDRKSTRLNSSHLGISYAVFC